MKTIILAFLLISTSSYCQTKEDFEKLSAIPKADTIIPVNYKISLPRPDIHYWDKDYALYKKFITRKMNSTQIGMAYVKNGVEIWAIANSVIPHAQLDTSILIKDVTKLYGTWRMIKYRNIKFADSARYDDNVFYRTDTTLSDISKEEELFFVFTDKNLQFLSKNSDKIKFKSKTTGYTLENGRSIILYKFLKASGVVGQIGIDENNLLILNFPAVIEEKLPTKYIVYNAIIEQIIFEKIK